MNYCNIENGQTILFNTIPVMEYPLFRKQIIQLLENKDCHCLNYFGYPQKGNQLQLICCIGNDTTSEIYVFSFLHDLNAHSILDSVTQEYFGMHIFEREISEKFGIEFAGLPWNKPVRYPFDRFNKSANFKNYPFYHIESPELHEVGVGPIHAGIIEPGHFRFICNGEKVLHLEIHLGYQHRGIESLFLQKKSLLERTILAESIAGDSVAANTTAFSMLMESMGNIPISKQSSLIRTIAIELERAAIHTGDLSALCTDIAYQEGSAVLQGLRTILINTFLIWNGNRFARRLIRVGANPFPINEQIKNAILKNLEKFEFQFNEMSNYMFNDPGVLARFEDTGVVTNEQAQKMQLVGMAARTCGIPRDIRKTHPYEAFKDIKHTPICLETGDVFARAMLRRLEVTQSLQYIRTLLKEYEQEEASRRNDIKLQANVFSIAITEGWRGELCHCAITDEKGELSEYKIKDPSLHNWMGLALAVRNNDISDFPVCNKSFDLSYCGYDL